MKLFSCPACAGRLYFENATCLRCGTNVAWQPFAGAFAAVPSPGIHACANASECACNWAVDAEGDLCAACRLTRTIPDMSIEGNRHLWIKVENAKKRAVYSLIAFGLDISPKADPADELGLAFDLLGDPITGDGPGGERVLTGHDNGTITINIAEADAPEREKMRIAMGERYRTVLGHFRHELGHYYWDRLVRDDAARLDRFRAVFGDEREDYMEALNRHYARGAPLDWQQRHVSPYAAMHPWEDWAEHWAHYVHITDTLEMVAALDFPLGRLDAAGARDLPPDLPPREANHVDRAARRDAGPASLLPVDFDDMLKRWLVLSEASNAINRCMGLPDLYPFVISDVAAEKLRFVHELLREQLARKLTDETERRVA